MPLLPSGDEGAAFGRLRRLVEAVEQAPDHRQTQERLRALFDSCDTWLGDIARHTVTQLADNPFYRGGLQAQLNGRQRLLRLYRGPRLSVTLCLLDPAEEGDAAPGDTVAFGSGPSLFKLLSPDPLSGRLAILSRRTGRCLVRRCSVSAGQMLVIDESRRRFLPDPPARQAMILRAAIRPDIPPVIGRYAVGTDQPQSLANADDALARVLALSVVCRLLGAKPPVDALRALLPTAPSTMRWALMREMLASDTQAAWPDLTTMASDDRSDTVRKVAGALVERLSRVPAAGAVVEGAL